MEPPPAAVPFSRLFACADRLDWALMIVGSLAAAAHSTALVVYLHYFAKIIHVLNIGPGKPEEQFENFRELLERIGPATEKLKSKGIDFSLWYKFLLNNRDHITRDQKFLLDNRDHITRDQKFLLDNRDHITVVLELTRPLAVILWILITKPVFMLASTSVASVASMEK